MQKLISFRCRSVFILISIYCEKRSTFKSRIKLRLKYFCVHTEFNHPVWDINSFLIMFFFRFTLKQLT